VVQTVGTQAVVFHSRLWASVDNFFYFFAVSGVKSYPQLCTQINNAIVDNGNAFIAHCCALNVAVGDAALGVPFLLSGERFLKKRSVFQFRG
jgi:hypothetical protein